MIPSVQMNLWLLNDFNEQVKIDWSKNKNIATESQRHRELRDFISRILRRKLISRYNLFKISIVLSKLCDSVPLWQILLLNFSTDSISEYRAGNL